MRLLVLKMRVDREQMLSESEAKEAVAATSASIQEGDTYGGTILDMVGETLGTYDLVDESPTVPREEDQSVEDRRATLNTNELVAIIIARLAEAAPGAKVILFGSRSPGHERPGSDVDLLVIEPGEVEKPGAESARLRKALRGMRVGVDLIVLGRSQAEEQSRWKGSFVSEALKGGRVIVDPPEFPWDDDHQSPARQHS